MQVVVDSLLTNYSVEGNGKNILMVHGWGDSMHTFDKLTSDFSKKFCVVRLDLPGFGKTQAPKNIWGLEEYAEFISKFLQKINKREVDVVIAHSNGAAICVKGITNNILSAKKLAIVAGAGVRNKNKTQKFIIKLVAKIGKMLTFWLPKKYKRLLQKKLYGTVGSDMLVSPELKETFKKTVSQDIQGDAKNITIPTILVYGKEDNATPPSYGEILHKLIQNSDIYLINDAGHFVHQDKHQEVLEILEDFIA